jgi:murein DD-endopeptidase MepM/ murein hydrolase activator NlpD
LIIRYSGDFPSLPGGAKRRGDPKEVGMRNIRSFFKMVLTPITIMLVPHSRTKPVSIRVPLAGILFSTVSFFVGVIYLFTIAVHTVEYYQMKERLSYVTDQFLEMKSTMVSLKQAEQEFKKLFSLKSKTDVLENAEFLDTGSLDMKVLRSQIDEATRSVTDIKKYIAEQKDIYRATPKGWPVPGYISSRYGYRNHPKSGARQLHTGLDISISSGTEILATADGIVTFSGKTGKSGNVVVIEHGHGYSTAYAHNSKNFVTVGQRVTRGETIGLAGSTGRSTGPHVHYEIWKDGRHVNPSKFLARR